MPIYSQAGRLISLSTPLGEDKLLLTGFTGHEAISRLFNFHLTALSEDSAIDFTQIVGQNVTISVTQSDDSQRYFNGLVSEFTLTGAAGDMTRYEMQVVPWTWMLTRNADCRIFHNKTVKEIIEQIFSTRGFSGYDFQLMGTYTPIEYCVQYRETDFNFISRLMEQYGIFYFYEHSESEHKMVIADSSSAHDPCPGQSRAGYNLAGGGLDAGDVVNSWSIGQELRTGKYTLTDYNFKTPSTDITATESTIFAVGGNSSLETFDYPGAYGTKSDGSAFAKLRMQEEEAVHKLARGSSVCRAFTSGYKFDLGDHPLDAMNATYILTEIQHVASVAGGYGEEERAGEDTYSNHFTCIPDDLTFRPARVTPKPFVQGLQTALVVGKSSDQDSADDDGSGGDGEEIWVDKYGRVMVKFPWDRKAACSCWARVSQDWAGQGWGMINIPRVGQEVLVSFLEGDPDRPIITGRVYNAMQTVPYPLPDNGTRTTFKTRSTPGGGDSNYNELRFEDKIQNEQVFIHGEKDYDTRIKHDSREWIGNNQSTIIQKSRMEKVGEDESLEIVGKRMEKIGGDDNLAITGKLNVKVGDDVSINTGANLYTKSGANYAHEAGIAIHLKAGTTMVLEAGVQLSLKAGGSFIDIGPAGIAISGAPLVMINSGGSAGSGSGSSPHSPAAPKAPDEADDGTQGTKMGGGSGASGSASSSGWCSRRQF